MLALVEDLQVPAVSGAHLAAGIKLAEHYAGEALRLFHAGRSDLDLLLAQRTLDWLLGRWSEDHVGLSDLYRLGPNPIRDSKTARKMIGMSRSNWPRLPCRGTCIGKSCG